MCFSHTQAAVLQGGIPSPSTSSGERLNPLGVSEKFGTSAGLSAPGPQPERGSRAAELLLRIGGRGPGRAWLASSWTAEGLDGPLRVLALWTWVRRLLSNAREGRSTTPHKLHPHFGWKRLQQPNLSLRTFGVALKVRFVPELPRIWGRLVQIEPRFCFDSGVGQEWSKRAAVENEWSEGSVTELASRRTRKPSSAASLGTGSRTCRWRVWTVWGK